MNNYNFSKLFFVFFVIWFNINLTYTKSFYEEEESVKLNNIPYNSVEDKSPFIKTYTPLSGPDLERLYFE